MKWIPLLIVALLAGCLGDDTPEGGDDPDLTTPGHGEHDEENKTGHMEPPMLNFTASGMTGQAPFNVTFDIAVSPATNGSYTLDFGDGNSEAGDMLPANHTYSYAAGNHTAMVVFTYEGGELNATLNITVTQVAIIIEDDGLCHAPDADNYGDLLYIHDRGGGSVWIYEESNGVAGLQLSDAPAPHGGQDDLGAGCVNGDTLLF